MSVVLERETNLRGAGTAVVLLGMLALAARPVGWAATGVAVIVGAAALAVPVVPGSARGRAPLVAGVGILALITARILLPSTSPAAIGLWGGAASLVAAVAEEALFRRLLFDRLSRFGPAAAIVLSAAAFALVHLPGYGLAAVPVNLGAGLLFGWQRWASGGWGPPAVTHAVANVMAGLG